MKIRYMVAIFLLCLPIFVIFQMPVDRFLTLADRSLQSNQVQILRSSGTIFSARVLAKARRQTMQLSWQLSPSSLLLLSPEVTFEIEGAESQLQGVLHAGFSGYDIELDGMITPSVLLTSFVPEVKTFPGQVLLSDLSMSLDRSFNPFSANGEINWPGGEVQVSTGRKRQSVSLPPLTARLSGGDDVQSGVSVSVGERGKPAPELIRLDVIQDMAELKIYESLGYLVGLTKTSEPEVALFEVSTPWRESEGAK